MQVKIEMEVTELRTKQTATKAKPREELSGARESIAGMRRGLNRLELDLDRE